MKTIKNCLVVVALLFAAVAFSQGVTTSSLGGQITDDQKEPLPGANIVAVHVPSGTTYGATTDFDGFYRISNMRSGGPYKITISYVGFKDFVRENVVLDLGQTLRISTSMVTDATALDEVVVTGVAQGSVFDGNRTGAETNINRRQIEALPQASRSVADFVRTTPQAQLTEGDDGFSISLAGQNNRYNAIYIDGAVNNDVFGLAGSGTNGGQTGVSPFSIDAIESFNIQLAPFDVKISGFAGGAINAVTRSGTNEISGSVYGFLRNESLAGKTPPERVDFDAGETRESLDEFRALTYGVRVGGPIIKDKLFFFVNYERQDEETPQPFNFSIYDGDTDLAGVNLFRDTVLNRYGYDIGGFNNTRTLTSDKITAKFDFNLNEKNKFILSARYVGAENLEARNSGSRTIGFNNGSEFFESNTISGSLEWNYQSNNVANSFIIGLTSVRDDRSPLGQPFPTLVIEDGFGNPFNGLQAGAERFSTANLLDQDIITITNNFEIYKGRHTITLGTHNEFSSSKNLFFPSNYGTYIYESLAQFINNDPVSDFERGYSVAGGLAVGDDSSGAAEFSISQLGFYAQDEVQFSDNFKLTAGIRFDMPIWENGPVNDDFNNRAVGVLEAAGKNLRGARVGKRVSTKVLLSPRLGFNWDVNGDKTTQIRGGLGIFTSRLPLVWPGGTYNNNGGATGAFSDEGDFATPITFNPDVNSQPQHLQPGAGEFGGNVDLFAPNFKLPQRFKFNLAVDQKLPLAGLVLSVDGIWQDNITEIFYENLNIANPTETLNGADNRPLYNRFSRVDPTYNRIILASNTGAGNSWNIAATLSKPFTKLTDKLGFSANASYSYGDAKSIFDGTSSQNSSQWRGIITVNGKNGNPPVARSGFAQGHRIISSVNFDIDWNDNLGTRVGLFYTGGSGTPFSYTYGGRDLLNDDSRDNALIYVPADESEINLVDSNENGSTADEWATLDGIISGDDYLSSRRGNYAERNAEFGPWSHILDLRLVQDFSFNVKGKKNTLSASFDIFNFTNLLNKDWGQQRFTPGQVNILDVDTNGADPIFEVNSRGSDNIIQLDDDGIQSSRWQMQVGLRYTFN
ncbi:carboxypeptidase regulatory-like domain-containing protein [Spongiivirga sp. MCCC 1A20706]|uniref:TonB-dependent receptor n=1 Tax=Spongiivirga sp. MCCC 1A20706 TaxID=3160963 RepID=UPI003977A252